MEQGWKTERIQNRKKRKEEFLQRHYISDPKPSFNFTNLPPTERLEYEMMDEQNYLEIYELFQNDSNTFVEDYYNDLEKLERYTDYQLYFNRFSHKRGACDWLIRLKTTKETIGVLNIYELSKEIFNNNHRKCFIGYSIGEKYRRKYYAMEVVENLIRYAFPHFKMEKLIANTDKGNIPSQELLLKLGFVEKTEDYYYFEIQKIGDVR